MSEKDIKLQVIHSLKDNFIFFPEVKGTHFTNKRLAIDYVIKPTDTLGWKNKNVAFGLEFKDVPSLDKKGDTNDFTKWIAQCVDYSHTYWDDFGYLYVLTCPGISTSKFVNAADKDRITARIVGHLGIGELRLNPHHGWTIYLQEQHRIWSEKGGVTSEGKKWSLERKFGSR